MAGKLLELDYRRFTKNGEPLPAWVRVVIDTHLAIEAEEASKAGTIGYMARAMVMAMKMIDAFGVLMPSRRWYRLTRTEMPGAAATASPR